jgi:hypothetical protein
VRNEVENGKRPDKLKLARCLLEEVEDLELYMNYRLDAIESSPFSCLVVDRSRFLLE